jgi:spore maturation protein CgeB
MVLAGYSPSVRLFEAAACGAAIASDNWPGLETFLAPAREILLPTGSDDVVRYLMDYELRRIGRAARERVLASHTSDVRASEFELAVEIAASPSKSTRALTTP